MFEKSKWIWERENPSPDEYADFRTTVTEKNATLFIAAETDYAAYINGKLAFFGSYKGYRDEKYYDELPLNDFLTEKENEIEIVVWYQGINCSSSIDDGAGVIFEISSNGKILAASDENILSRSDIRYKNGYKKSLTPQLGYSFLFDATKCAEMKPDLWHKSFALARNVKFSPRPVKKSVVSAPVFSEEIKQENGVYLFDLKKEYSGQIYLDFYSETEQKILISYGEHIRNGEVTRIVGNRDFSFEYIAKRGENKYVNPFRRLGLRYIEVKTEQPVKVGKITVLSVDYPVKKRVFAADSPLHEKITSVAIRTLALCMHEHYEDCVWREQALYTFDSRNEMLCGYKAFYDDGFARSNILLMAKGVREDGLLELTYPAEDTPAIPLYSLCFIVLVYEYVRFTGDKSVLGKVGKTMRGIMDKFRKLRDNRLIADFPYPYWNFYEWGNCSDNCGDLSRNAGDTSPERFSLILNAYYIYTEEKYAELFPHEKVDLSDMKKLIAEKFYDEKAGMFRSYIGEKTYTEFGNALCLSIGLGGEDLAEKITQGKALKATLAAAAYVYDALLSFGKKYEDYVINEIDKNYKKMLDAGATSFWETVEGVEDGDLSCSLCHGWSALPIYYYALTGGIKFSKE